MSRPGNVWERSKRASKVSALIAAIDSKIGTAAHTVPDAIARWLRTLDREEWASIAREMAMCNPPTYRAGVSETVNQVIAAYDDRAERISRRNPPAIRLPAIQPKGH